MPEGATRNRPDAPRQPAPSRELDVLVVGAGPAGLTAGYLLAGAGRSVVVIEKDARHVGGISRTVDYKGYLLDIGGHRFFSKSAEIEGFWREILPKDFIERPRLSRILYDGKYYTYPLEGLEALRNLGLLRSAACIGSYLWARIFPIRRPRTFHDWVRNQFGERLFRIFFKTYTEKVWGMSCDTISADWAAQRIRGLSLAAAARAALRPRRRRRPGGKGKVIKTLIGSFRYPRRGPGMMWQACAAKMEARGGTLLMGRTLAGLRWDAAGGLWTVRVDTADGPEVLRARHVVSSAPLPDLLGAIAPSPASLPRARALGYRDFLIVALIVARPGLFPDNWIYVHDPSVAVGRVQNFGSWSPEMVPDPATTCLGMEYFCFEGDGLWTASDEDLVARATREAAQLGLCDAADVADGCVLRQPRAYPVYDADYRGHVAAIRQDIERAYPTLHVVGRNGMHKYNNQDHAMMTAMLTVRNILAGRRVYDVWEVNEDAEYHEAGRNREPAAHADGMAFERAVPRSVAGDG